jgi:hypothetical protein
MPRKKVDVALYNFLKENECHLYRERGTVNAFVVVNFKRMSEFVETVGEYHFEEHGIRVTMKKDYICIELNDIIDSLDDDLESYKDCFDEDEWEDMENPYITEFYNKEYVGDYDENGILFVYIVNEYYNDEPSNESFKKQTPILIVNDYEKLTTMFGERWKEPLKKWFEDNYELPVKTIVRD